MLRSWEFERGRYVLRISGRLTAQSMKCSTVDPGYNINGRNSHMFTSISPAVLPESRTASPCASDHHHYNHYGTPSPRTNSMAIHFEADHDASIVCHTTTIVTQLCN